MAANSVGPHSERLDEAIAVPFTLLSPDFRRVFKVTAWRPNVDVHDRTVRISCDLLVEFVDEQKPD